MAADAFLNPDNEFEKARPHNPTTTAELFAFSTTLSAPDLGRRRRRRERIPADGRPPSFPSAAVAPRRACHGHSPRQFT